MISAADLEKQIAEPNHCWLAVEGRILRHTFAPSPGEPDNPLPHLLGKPVRFTRLAASEVIRKGRDLVNIKMVEIVEGVSS